VRPVRLLTALAIAGRLPRRWIESAGADSAASPIADPSR
jgi:hypothetical protein